jgi:acyl carrier protein
VNSNGFDAFLQELLRAVPSVQNVGAGDIGIDTDILEGNVFDSLQVLDLHTWLEERTGRPLEEEDVFRLRTLGDVYAWALDAPPDETRA